MVRQIIFDDHVQWTMRIPMPRRIINNDQSFRINTRDEYWTEERREEMESEVHTMRYIRKHSTIRVPEVFEFDSTVDNPISAPYMFMECVRGAVISSPEIPRNHIEKVHTAIAKFQVLLPNIMLEINVRQFELSTLHFDQIGAIRRDLQGEYCIGPIPGIGGPFSNSASYYRSWALANNRRRDKPDLFPNQVSRAADILSAKPSGPFSLSLPHFGYHNFIVDDDYVQCIICNRLEGCKSSTH
jgi:hypothetical protein